MNSNYISTPNGANYADSRELRAVEVGTSLTTQQERNTMNEVLTPARLKQLAAMQGTRGIIGGMVSKACLLTNGVYYVDVLAESPALVDATTRNGDSKYGDDNGNFALAKLYNDVSSNVNRKRDKATLDGHDFPNVEAIRDDDAGTVYIVNWDRAPSDDDDSDDDDA